MKVMSVAYGSKILGSYQRIYNKKIIQQNAIDGSPKNIHLLALNLAYAPGCSGPVLSVVSLNKTR
jgi:hypothetical protein